MSINRNSSESVFQVFPQDTSFSVSSFNDVLDSLPSASYVIFPGFCDVHVHFREPGFSYKETVFSGSCAAARGGYTDVFTMPNLNPVPDSVENLNIQRDIIPRSAVINVHPYASITVGQKGEELSDMDALAPICAGFSDDGHGVQSADMMKEAMLKAKALGKIIVAHCEDNSLLNGGYIHDGVYAAEHGHKGICSESEWGPIKRDIALAKETGCAYHVCHISCRESVELIRQAKKDGVDITCETAPHYLTLTDADLQEDGCWKMNPPLRSYDDREALIEGLIDGTIDCIATDHAPHDSFEKGRGLEKSAFGIVGIETAFQVLYTNLVKTGRVPLQTVINALTINPRRRFGLEQRNDCFSVWNLDEEYIINPFDFLSKGQSTPFAGMKVYGKNLLTVCNGRPVHKEF